MTYQVQIVAPVTRAATIKAKIEASTDRPRDFYAFRNRKYELPVIQVPIGLPVYRMENFRTFTDQREYLSKEKEGPDFFAKGQESETAQQAQHNLLVKLAQTGREGSIVPVIDVLKREGQREPLLITSSGVVVNGNRRLAALRELFAGGTPTEFPQFSHIDVMVLPADATEEEILDVEANLQAMPETKLEYDWIGEAQLIKRLVGLGRSQEDVAKQLHLKEKDVKSAIQRLAEADLYLAEEGGMDAFIDIRDNAEQFFRDLTKAIEDKSERAREGSRAIAYALYRNRDRLPGRLYSFNAAFGKLADDVLDRVSTNLGIATEAVEAQDDEDETDVEFSLDDLDIDIGETDAELNYELIIEALRAADNEDAIEALIDAAQTAVELDAGLRSGRDAIKTIGQAHSKLASVDMNKAAADTLRGIKKQLDAIKGRVAELEEVLNMRLKA